MKYLLLAASVAIGVVAKEPMFEIVPNFDITRPQVSAFQDHPGLLMGEQREANFRAAMPVIADHDNDWRGLYYTSDEHPAMHQSNGGRWMVGPSPAFVFPWRNPGGTDDMDQTKHYTWKVLQLPLGTTVRTFANGTGSLRIWDWTFPVGTRFVEAFSYPDMLKVFEIRTRQKQSSGVWDTRRYFPQKDASLVEGSGEWSVSDKVHVVPAFPTMDLRVDRVGSGGRDFVELVETKWVPTTRVEGAIVPRGYHGFLAVKSCRNCHDSAGKEAKEFSPTRYPTGERVRGSFSEGILSFTPRDQRLVGLVGGAGVLR